MKAKSRKRLLISSIAMLLVAMLALGTATYAWFSVNKTVTADTLKVTATAPKGLQVTTVNGEASDAITSEYWGNKKSFGASSTASVNAVSVPFAGDSGKVLPANYFFPQTVKDASTSSKAIYSSDADNGSNFEGWQTVSAYPSVVTTKGTDSYGKAYKTVGSNNVDTMVAFKVGVRSTDNISSETVTGKVTFQTDTGKQYVKVAVFEVTASDSTVTGGTSEAKALIADKAETIKAISAVDTLTVADVTYAADTSATWTFTGLNGAGAATNTAKYFYILMWVEGQDPEANDTNPSLTGNIKVEFSY